MGDWEDAFGSAGMSADFAPWESPTWNNDWEYELREKGYLTVEEWNQKGRSVIKGQKGTWLTSAKVAVFSESQTIPNHQSSSTGPKKVFETFEEAKKWSIANPGKVYTRTPDGKRYIEK